MVLQELGTKLTSALRRLHTDTVVDKETIKAVVGDICRALLESDVNVQMVMKLRKNVEAKAEALVGDQQDGGRGGAGGGAAQQRRSIQKAVVDELTGMLDPKRAPYKMKKGKSNVVMFVGLQVRFLVRSRRRQGRTTEAVLLYCLSGLGARYGFVIPLAYFQKNVVCPQDGDHPVSVALWNTAARRGNGSQQACVRLGLLCVPPV